MTEGLRTITIRRGETVYHPADMSAAALTDLEMLLHSDICRIKDSLAAAHAKVVTDGVYADPDWRRRAKTAQSIKARQLEQVKRLRADAARRERRASDPIGTFFMDAARVQLPPEMFKAILADAITLRDGAGRQS